MLSIHSLNSFWVCNNTTNDTRKSNKTVPNVNLYTSDRCKMHERLPAEYYPVSAQFTKLPNKIIEHDTDSIMYSSKNPVQCASFCVNNAGFICNSFDYCVSDQTCHLSRLHTTDGTAMASSPTCDHFSSSFIFIIS